MAAGDLTTVQAVKDWLGITGTTSDALLATLVTAASKFFVTQIDRDILLASYSERYDGEDGFYDTLVLRNYPVASITLVQDTGVAIPAGSADTGAYGYVCDFTRGLLTLNGVVSLYGQPVSNQRGKFNAGFQNILVQYSAGFSVAPADVAQAVVEICGLWMRRRLHVDESSKQVGGATIYFVQQDVPQTAKSVIERYRRKV